MDYRQALSSLLGLVDFERMDTSTRRRVRYDLARIEALLSRLGDPHTSRPTVHIAGTKGKGSTAAMCTSVLSSQGYRTGLFTSPHLHTFRERISLDGEPVSEIEFSDLVQEVWPDLEGVSAKGGHGEVTMFEALTAMAFCHFRRRADVQVIEVGLGGRLDTTNLVTPTVCAITSLSLDHTSILGNTIESIASEKAGIIKPGVPVITAPQEARAMATIEDVCRDRGARLIKVGEEITWTPGTRGPQGQGFTLRGRLEEYQLSMPLLGSHQLENAATAVGVLEALTEADLPISRSAMARGFEGVSWPCRMEVLSASPLVVCDGAHNDHSAARLRESLHAYLDFCRAVLVVGISADKNLGPIVRELATIGADSTGKPARVIATRSRHPRSAPARAVAEMFTSVDNRLDVSVVEGVDRALSAAIDEAVSDASGTGTLVLATGSLFVAAEAREALKGIEPELYPEVTRAADPAMAAEDRR